MGLIAGSKEKLHWKVSMTSGGDNDYWITADDSHIIAKGLSKEHAAFIVRACNAYYEYSLKDSSRVSLDIPIENFFKEGLPNK